MALQIEGLRIHGKIPVFKLRGIDSRDAALALAGLEVSVDPGQLLPLGEGQYYVEDLVGMEAVSEDGAAIGKIQGILPNPAHDILDIALADGGEMLAPMIDVFVPKVDLAGRRVTQAPIDGLEGLVKAKK